MMVAMTIRRKLRYTAAEWHEFDRFIVNPDSQKQVALVARMLLVNPNRVSRAGLFDSPFLFYPRISS
jgi:hypothetical protein